MVKQGLVEELQQFWLDNNLPELLDSGYFSLISCYFLDKYFKNSENHKNNSD